MNDISRARSPFGPLRVMFLNTSLPIGGAETLQLNLIRQFDRQRVLPEVCCLKQPGPLGDVLAAEVPLHSDLIRCKYDAWVLRRLILLFRQRRIDAVVTVGAGDKMFWGRLAARGAGVPVVIAALHSTGWPDGVGRLNRLLTPLTDAFVAVASSHRRFLVEEAHFPESKVHVIPNGVDTQRFTPGKGSFGLRQELGIGPTDPVVGIVAALRPEKNHELFLAAAELTLRSMPDTKFVIVGDGPERSKLATLAARLHIDRSVRFVGTREDVPQLLNLFDVFALTSHMEASPVSILEAMACGKPVVATRVGSVEESVEEERTGYLVTPGDSGQVARRWCQLLQSPLTAGAMGACGRREVSARWSLQAMVRGYETLITQLYQSKCDMDARLAETTPVALEVAAEAKEPSY